MTFRLVMVRKEGGGESDLEAEKAKIVGTETWAV